MISGGSGSVIAGGVAYRDFVLGDDNARVLAADTDRGDSRV